MPIIRTGDACANREILMWALAPIAPGSVRGSGGMRSAAIGKFAAEASNVVGHMACKLC